MRESLKNTFQVECNLRYNLSTSYPVKVIENITNLNWVIANKKNIKTVNVLRWF